MAKETLAEKIAKKTFQSADFQRSWAVHMQAFGPILEPAFADNYQARIHLTAALNRISRRDIKGGLDKLKEVQKYIANDADKAAWLFFMGVCFEMAGAKEQMLSCYQQAAEFQHKFYLPYLKVAKSAHNDAVFEVAEENYRAAIHCFDATGLDDQSRTILASAYTNLASCLTMMHRYEEAQAMLHTSCQLLPRQQGRIAAEAVLQAAMGNGEKVAALLSELEKQNPAALEGAKSVTEDILAGTHPHFSRVEVAPEKITAFWDWFLENREELQAQLAEEQYDQVFALLQTNLKPLFPFMERDPEMGIQPEEKGFRITFADFYMVSLERGYAELIEACPAELEDCWEFEIAH